MKEQKQMSFWSNEKILKWRKHMRTQETSQARTRNLEKVQKSDIERVVLRSNLHKKYSSSLTLTNEINDMRSLRSSKSLKLDKSISSTKSIFLVILCRSLLTIDNFSSSTINTIIEQTSLVLYWLSLVTKTSRNVVILLVRLLKINHRSLVKTFSLFDNSNYAHDCD